MIFSNNLESGLEFNFSFSVSSEMMTEFGRISGDFHPVHTEDDYARGRGFMGRIVYGGILVAQVSRLIGMEIPAQHCVWTQLKVDFIQPLYINERADLNAQVVGVSEAVNALIMKFRILAGDRLIARGKAEVSFAYE